MLSWQALFRVLPVVSPRTCGGCGRTPNLGTTKLLLLRESAHVEQGSMETFSHEGSLEQTMRNRVVGRLGEGSARLGVD